MYEELIKNRANTIWRNAVQDVVEEARLKLAEIGLTPHSLPTLLDAANGKIEGCPASIQAILAEHVINGVKIHVCDQEVADPFELKAEPYTSAELNKMLAPEVDKVALAMGISTEGNKGETIKLILDKQEQ